MPEVPGQLSLFDTTDEGVSPERNWPNLPETEYAEDDVIALLDEVDKVGNIIADLLDTESMLGVVPNGLLTADEREFLIAEHYEACLPQMGITDPIELGYEYYTDRLGAKKFGAYYEWCLARLNEWTD